MRAAIRARAESLGVEKSKVSQQYIEEARARAVQGAAEARSRPPGSLDLSQISTGDEPRRKGADKWDDTLPTMLYDPADELTKEEQAEADKVGLLNPWEQAVYEFKESTWPGPPAVIKQVFVLAAVVCVTLVVIVGWDGVVRNVYTDMGMIPRKEDIPGELEDLNLPEGFTNNMNEDDISQLTQDMNKAAKAAGLSSPSVDALIQDTIPDI